MPIIIRGGELGIQDLAGGRHASYRKFSLPDSA